MAKNLKYRKVTTSVRTCDVHVKYVLNPSMSWSQVKEYK